MGLFKRVALLFCTAAACSAAPPPHIGYLIHCGNIDEAIAEYDTWYQENYTHDFDTLEKLGISLLEQGWRSKEVEEKVLALFGASVAAHDKVTHILAEGLESPVPQIQLISLNFLAKQQTDEAEKAIHKALSSPYLPIRLEAAFYLALKKDRKAVTVAETLMGKLPAELKALFPKIFASAGTPDATRIVKKLMSDSQDRVRIEAILSAAEFHRDELIPSIRSRLKQHNSFQQEACAIALAVLKDEESIPQLEKIADSKNENVRLAACYALVQMGQKEKVAEISKLAQEGNVFAITALGATEGTEELLAPMLESSNPQVKFNAALSLLERRDPRAVPVVTEILIRDARDLGFAKLTSPSGAMSSCKVISSATQHAQNTPFSMELSVSIREEALAKCAEYPQEIFLGIIEQLFRSHQTELVPMAIALLENVQSQETVALLQKYLHLVGAPLTRSYAALALYKMRAPGNHAETLFDWIQENRRTKLIEFRTFIPLEARLNRSPFDLTPEQSSKLLVDTLEAFAKSQDDQGIYALLNAIHSGHPKNKYALAGLLIRTNQ